MDEIYTIALSLTVMGGMFIMINMLIVSSLGKKLNTYYE